jgi:uncharacterized protein
MRASCVRSEPGSALHSKRAPPERIARSLYRPAFPRANALTFLLALALCGRASAQQPPPPPDRWVTDRVGLLSPQVRGQLDARLETLERTTGHQVIVFIDASTQGEPIETFAEQAFAAWHVGRKGLDDGAILFIFSKDRAARIEVGYGLEPVLPDAVCSRIIREQIAPAMKDGDADRAVSSGIDAILNRLGAAPGEPAAERPRLTRPQLITLGVLGLGFLVLLLVRPDLALQLLFIFFLSRRGGGGGGRGSGGFSGGGGRSGGGGASGRW